MKQDMTIKVRSGRIPATHHHPTYGYCIITQRNIPGLRTIQTNTGTAIVPLRSIQSVRTK